MTKLPHPIPYQGSKRSLAPMIGPYIPRGVETFFEPFAGSAAMTIWAAHNRVARHFILADSLEPMVDLLRAIVEEPEETAGRYRAVWNGQREGETGYFNEVRERYNAGRDPVDLLYLICRCVKNAVRFNSNGRFTQSVDKRRLGQHPDKLTSWQAPSRAFRPSCAGAPSSGLGTGRTPRQTRARLTLFTWTRPTLGPPSGATSDTTSN